jgi:prepilin-type N-terminal cleavage/methylation domain-containing protein
MSVRQRKHRRMNQRGVTLVELMIAITLVAVISVGMLMATRTGLLSYQKTQQRLDQNRVALHVADIVNRQLNSLVPAMGDCPNAAGGITSVPLFYGTQTSLIAVSQFSIAEGNRGYPQIVEYQVTSSPAGGLRLTVNEFPYAGPSSAAAVCRNGTILPVEATATSVSVVLADQLLACNFTFHKLNDPLRPTEDTGWLPDWIFPVAPPAFPAAIRIEMLPSSAARPDQANPPLPFPSVTVPIRTDRFFQEQYVQ